MFRSEQIADTPEKIFNEKKRKFFFTFIRRFPDAIELYRKYGLMSKKEGWSNVAHHCAVQAVAADTIGSLINLNDNDRRNLSRTALYHDFYKRKSIEAMRNSQANQLEIDDSSDAAVLEILKQENVDPKVIDLLDKSYGYDSFELEKIKKMSVSEKILSYLDHITMDDDLVPLKDRIAGLKNRYPKINDAGIARYGQPTYDQQYQAGAAIEIDLARQVGLENPEALPIFIKTKIQERINQITLVD